jgi:membrane protease YdiL (CAAX protease family)
MGSDDSLIVRSLRVHLLMFPRRAEEDYGNRPGWRLLGAFVLVAIVLDLALRAAFAHAGLLSEPLAFSGFVAILIVAFVAMHRWLVRIPFSCVGLQRFVDWSREEKLYLYQVVPLASALFAFVFRDHLGGLVERHGIIGFLIYSLATGLAWGMVQELLYRGWLQTELVRRWGGMAGILGANLVFTFGPLHANLYLGQAAPQWGTLAAVFGIGLLFGAIYRRSGNVWLPAILHGLWPLNMN